MGIFDAIGKIFGGGKAVEYQKNIALRQAEARQLQQQLEQQKARIQERKERLRGS